jgi:hypothetical protein
LTNRKSSGKINSSQRTNEKKVGKRNSRRQLQMIIANRNFKEGSLSKVGGYNKVVRKL